LAAGELIPAAYLTGVSPPSPAQPDGAFGIIKSVLGFRQFLLRGLDAVRGEWRLVTLAWNLKRMFALGITA
jgi:Transposase DDE domain